MRCGRSREPVGETKTAPAPGERAPLFRTRALDQLPTIDPPKNESTWPIGFATAIELLPANRSPTARALVLASSTINEPESPLFKNLLAVFRIKIWPEYVLVNAEPPAHSFSYAT